MCSYTHNTNLSKFRVHRSTDTFILPDAMATIWHALLSYSASDLGKVDPIIYIVYHMAEIRFLSIHSRKS